MNTKTDKVKKMEAEAFGIIATLSALAIRGVTSLEDENFVLTKGRRLRGLMNQIKMLEGTPA